MSVAARVPGFNDVHAHVDRKGLKQLRPSLVGACCIADILEIVAALARDGALSR